jgi:hypothetical protein
MEPPPPINPREMPIRADARYPSNSIQSIAIFQ